jgi:hypothetical protein
MNEKGKIESRGNEQRKTVRDRRQTGKQRPKIEIHQKIHRNATAAKGTCKSLTRGRAEKNVAQTPLCKHINSR